MKTLQSLLMTGLVLSLSSVMGQNAETVNKASVVEKKTVTATNPEKDTRSGAEIKTAKTGTYQKAEKSQATKLKPAGSKRKPKTKKERLEMEASNGGKAGSPVTPVLDSFKPGADGFIEVNHGDIEVFLKRLGDGRFKIESFTLVYTQNGVVKRIVNNSSVISDEIQNTLKGFPVGQTFSIEDVKGTTRNGKEITVPVSKFRIKANNAEASRPIQKN